MEAVATILLLAAFVAPWAALWWGYRWYRRRRSQPARLDRSEQRDEVQAQETSPRFSFPYGVPLIIYPVLLIAIASGRQSWWAYVLDVVYLGLIGVFAWLAASVRQFEKIQQGDSTLNRLTWVLNWGLFFVLLPLIAWVVLALPHIVGSKGGSP